MTKVLVAGFTGAMGQKAAQLVLDTEGFELVAVYSPTAKSQNPLDYGFAENVKVFQSEEQIVTDAEVWIDFTVPTAVYGNVKFALTHGMRPVVGTTGLTDEQESELKQLALDNNLGGLIAPNFGMSAVLLMMFAKQAAKYFPDVEVIEMHHGDKADAPSGTALSTAKMIAEVRPEHEQGNPNGIETLENVRGGDYQGIRVHSVRLPGYIAHEQVLFGGQGEALTIRQDSFDRQSFMTGVKVALQKVMDLNELVIGLENIL